MNLISEIFSFARHSTLSLPSLEVALLLAILTVCLLMRFSRAGLLFAYGFLFRWVWMMLIVQKPEFVAPYAVFGGLIGILTILTFMRQAAEKHSSS